MDNPDVGAYVAYAVAIWKSVEAIHQKFDKGSLNSRVGSLELKMVEISGNVDENRRRLDEFMDRQAKQHEDNLDIQKEFKTDMNGKLQSFTNEIKEINNSLTQIKIALGIREHR